MLLCKFSEGAVSQIDLLLLVSKGKPNWRPIRSATIKFLAADRFKAKGQFAFRNIQYWFHSVFWIYVNSRNPLPITIYNLAFIMVEFVLTLSSHLNCITFFRAPSQKCCAKPMNESSSSSAR